MIFIFILTYTATEENVADRMSKFGPLVESTIPTVIVTVENNRKQNNEKESLADEEEYEKEEKNDNVKGKRILKSNEKLRSRGKYLYFSLFFVVLSFVLFYFILLKVEVFYFHLFALVKTKNFYYPFFFLQFFVLFFFPTHLSGFAFVTYLCEADAEKAVAGMYVRALYRIDNLIITFLIY